MSTSYRKFLNSTIWHVSKQHCCHNSLNSTNINIHYNTIKNLRGMVLDEVYKFIRGRIQHCLNDTVTTVGTDQSRIFSSLQCSPPSSQVLRNFLKYQTFSTYFSTPWLGVKIRECGWLSMCLSTHADKYYSNRKINF